MAPMLTACAGSEPPFSTAGAHDACAVFRYRTDADLVSSAGNVCNLAFLLESYALQRPLPPPPLRAKPARRGKRSP